MHSQQPLNIPQRVMVTGANGHIGQRLVKAMSGNLEAVAVVRSEAAKKQLQSQLNSGVTHVGNRKRCAVEVVDYLDIAGLRKVVSRCHAVVHLAGIIKETRSNRYAQAHEETCKALLAAISGSPVDRIIYLSILGSQSDSKNACLASKGCAQDLLRQAALPVLILQVPMVLGEAGFATQALTRQASASVTWLVRAASQEQPLYVGDVITGILNALEQTEFQQRTLALAGPVALSQRELVTRAAAVLGRSPKIFSLPYVLVRWLVRMLEVLVTNPAMTAAMLEILDHDNVADPAEACRSLNIRLTSLDEMLRRCIGT